MVFTKRSVNLTLPTKFESMMTTELFEFRLDSDGPYCTTCVSGSYVIEGVVHTTTTVTLLMELALSPVGTAGLEGPAIYTQSIIIVMSKILCVY